MRRERSEIIDRSQLPALRMIARQPFCPVAENELFPYAPGASRRFELAGSRSWRHCPALAVAERA